MTKLTVVSDIHLEFSEIDIKPSADILILSGDILVANVLNDFPEDYPLYPVVSSRHMQSIRFRNFLRSCSEDFKHVIYVAGNHEFYYGSWNRTLTILKDECSKYSNIHFLENSTVDIDNLLFVGATLWSNFNKSDPLSMITCSGPKGLNDFQRIRNEQKSYSRLKPDDVISRHRRTLDYFETVISNAPKDKKVVVVTHHAPSFSSISESFKDDYYINGAYASDLSDFILNHPNICLWTHGHIHSISDYKIGDTRVICNPRGYVSYSEVEMTHWNPNLLIEL